MQLLSEHTKTLPPLKVSDVVSIQNQHWPQPALRPEQTPLIGWTHAMTTSLTAQGYPLRDRQEGRVPFPMLMNR